METDLTALSTELKAFTGEAKGTLQKLVEADNETATLRVKLPPKAREGDGRLVHQGIVRVSPRPAHDVVVQLHSSDPAELEVPPTVILPAGQASAAFDLFVVDDARIDGTRMKVIHLAKAFERIAELC